MGLAVPGQLGDSSGQAGQLRVCPHSHTRVLPFYTHPGVTEQGYPPTVGPPARGNRVNHPTGARTTQPPHTHPSPEGPAHPHSPRSGRVGRQPIPPVAAPRPGLPGSGPRGAEGCHPIRTPRGAGREVSSAGPLPPTSQPQVERAQCRGAGHGLNTGPRPLVPEMLHGLNKRNPLTPGHPRRRFGSGRQE